MTAEQKQFIEKVGRMAQEDMGRTGVLASLTIAQAILESGWGKSGLTVKGNALFGIKAGSSWKGKVYSSKTQECYDGVNYTTITALFRAYDSWEESVADHSALLTGLSRYAAVVGETDYRKACEAIQAAGYATAPTYAQQLIKIIDTYSLTDYDAGGEGKETDGKMKSTEFVRRAKDIAQNYKTLYVMGCFGAPLTGGNVSRYCTNHSYNKAADRTAMIKAAANQNPPVYGFDCVCLIKGILWGWCGDASKIYGGAGYAINGVPDIGADSMIKVCQGVTTNFSNIVPGEAVWMSGHIGIYIGDGLAVECSPKWANKVQITAVGNIGSKAGYNTRTWTKHGKLPYITYEAASEPQTPPAGGGSTTTDGNYSVGDIVQFKGGPHFTNANAASAAATVAAGPAKVTAISKGAKHPYHVIHTDGSSSVYGWVNASDIQATGGSSAGSGGTETVYTVVHGDSLWAIAERFLGAGSRYTEIKEANGLKDNTIYSGQKLKIPGAAGGTAAPAEPAKKQVTKGSTVRLKKGAKTYSGQGLASFVYERNHIVSEINGDRAVITYGGVVVAAVHTSDLTVQ